MPAADSYIATMPYAATGATGQVGTALSAAFTVINQAATQPPTTPPPPAPPTTPPPSSTAHSIVRFVLVNADTDKDIQTLNGGAILNLATLPTRNLNIRAESSGAVKTVKFVFDNKITRTEGAAPYSFWGDVNVTDYNAWTPALGAHQLVAMPYNASGQVGNALSVSFQVINQAPATTASTTSSGLRVTALKLIDADRDIVLRTLSSGSTVSLASLPTRRLNLVADVAGSVQSVQFHLNGKLLRTENDAPYAVFGDTKGDFHAWTPIAGTTYTFVATPFTQGGANGTAGGALSPSVTFVP